MTARIITLAEFRASTPPQPVPQDEQDFQRLFTSARDLRSLAPSLSPEEVAVMDWPALRNWFQQELAKEVFLRKLFRRSVLVSICFVSDLLLAFTRGEHPDIGIEEHLDRYMSSGDSADVLRAANSAFLFFVFWPEMRSRRSLSYRKFAVQHGPPLYANYAGITKRNAGYDMADAFEPLGDIARERFAGAS
jgi:hypothetical protein